MKASPRAVEFATDLLKELGKESPTAEEVSNMDRSLVSDLIQALQDERKTRPSTKQLGLAVSKAAKLGFTEVTADKIKGLTLRGAGELIDDLFAYERMVKRYGNEALKHDRAALVKRYG